MSPPRLLGFLICASASAAPGTLVIPRVATPPKLADFLAGVPPTGFAVIKDFIQRDPKDGAPATHATTVYLGYDADRIYAVFLCADDPKKVRARVAKREDVGNDDIVGILLDTFHDKQRHYVFYANAHGVQQDAIQTEGQDTDNSFDTLWQSDGRMTREGYAVLIAIPFKSIRFPNREKQTWGIAFYRSVLRDNEYANWPHISSKVEGVTQQFATLEGLEGISPGRNLQFIPYVLGSLGRILDNPFDAMRRYRTANDIRGGLDAKIVLKDAVTLDLTVNPDFSQVEGDEPQVTVNQRYEVFYPERRPFFIENSGYFQTPINLFFSRRIADPQFGARVTGKIGRWSFGALTADDRSPLASTGGRAMVAVAALRREFAKQSNIGFLLTTRKLGAETSEVFSADTRIKIGKNWVYTGQYAHAKLESPFARKSGDAIHSELAFSGRRGFYSAKYRDISPEFDSRLAFIQRTDIREAVTGGVYRFRPNKRVLAWGPFLFGAVNYDRQGRLQNRDINPGGNVEMKGLFLYGNYGNASELYRGVNFHRQGWSVGANGSRKHYEYNLGFDSGTATVYSPASGLRPFIADQRAIHANVTLRPRNNIAVTGTYNYTRLATVRPLLNDHVLRAKINYQRTRRLSFRAIFDYFGTLPDERLIASTRDKRLVADLLAGYLVNPGTAIYAGYTNRYENLSTPGLRFGPPDLSTGRQVFVKVSYLIRR